MYKITEKTLLDLEFDTIKEQIAAFCVTEMGKDLMSELTPYPSKEEILVNLDYTNEYVSSFSNENRIPSHQFETIKKEIQLLSIENSYLETKSFLNILNILISFKELHVFFKKFDEYYPNLNEKISSIELNREIEKTLKEKIDRFGQVKDKASTLLQGIRKEINIINSQLNKSFNGALSRYASAGYLDDIRESVIDNKRVLAVQPMYRKKVKGSLLGTSKTGSILFIEPQETYSLTQNLEKAKQDEKQEIIRILKELTNYLRPYQILLMQYQNYLAFLDVIFAKATYAQKINGILPKIADDREFYLKDAYHPLLLVKNKELNINTIPQDMELDDSRRIIVISGPNAGGKSITLKTIGLLQVMIQSGILIPVHERSKICLFQRILTDIGDNQSIENQLSTYSYRLKNMNYFLKKCNANTMFLIDEFGTGSDPELGGALAEVFLEDFYYKGAFGIITTHYSNLKILANELPNCTNACMLFNERTLEPMFKLDIGQPGSSFTFEVAQKNGIPYSLINKAKKRIEKGKIRFDRTIVKMQKERSRLEKTTRSLQKNELETREKANQMDEINQKIQEKLERYQEIYDSNQKIVSLGKRIDKLALNYMNHKQKKRLYSEFLRIVEMENSKRKPKVFKPKKEFVKEKIETKKVEKELEKEVNKIRERKKIEKEEKAKQPPKPKHPINIGNTVRLIDGKAVGTVDKIEKNIAFVNYGLFTTKVKLEELEFVKK